MAKLPRGLCFLLIVWLLLSRPSTASRTESPNLSPWWGTEQFLRYKEQSEQFRKAGNFVALEALYKQADRDAARAGDVSARVKYLTALGNTYVYMFRYAESLDVYRTAETLAEQARDWEAAGAVAPGLSSVYYLVGDWPAARLAVEEGLADVAHLKKPPYYKAQLMLQSVRLQAGTGDSISAALEAIDEARTQSDSGQNELRLEAQAWDLIGEEYIRTCEWSAAEQALGQALRLRLRKLPDELHFSYERLGALRLAQAMACPKTGVAVGRDRLLAEAQFFTAQAMKQAQHGAYELATGVLFHQRGLILRAQGHPEMALDDFAAAARMADRWRLVVPSADSSLTAANVRLERQVFRTFVEASATQALQTGSLHWIQTSFGAAELNRAASLRQSRQLAEVWRQKLPSQYWALLSQLRTEEASHLAEDQPTDADEDLQLKLTKMEAAVGLGLAPIRDESLQDPASLVKFQRGLDPSELLLSFHTGAEASYLWAMTQDSLHLYKLPDADSLSASVGRFRSAVMGGEAVLQTLGTQLSQTLFGQLTPQETGRKSWLLSLDGSLFELPFAALAAPKTEALRSSLWNNYLIEDHSLQIIPGALFLTPRSSREPVRNPAGSETYVGVSDAVYNTADSRYSGPWYGRFLFKNPATQLNRLVASGDEVQQSAKAWQLGRQNNGGTQTALVLTGLSATRERFLSALTATRPSTIHLATHVLMRVGTGEKLSDQAFLAFSIGESGRPDLLTTSEVALLQVSGSLVVMTGCASGTGDVVAGAGLLGLTRAWLVAGASAVVATGWAVEDSHGALLPTFYRHARQSSVAEALRASQVEMLHSGTWQAEPAYWASYQVTGGAR